MNDNTHKKDTMLYSMMDILGPMSKITIKVKQSDNYNFIVNDINDINLKKITDDLSYSDPLRIVQCLNETWAVVHHTVYDKYRRSEMYGTKDIPISPIDHAIMSPAKIKPYEIKQIVNCIRAIKQSKWIKRDKPIGHLVTVTKVKI